MREKVLKAFKQMHSTLKRRTRDVDGDRYVFTFAEASSTTDDGLELQWLALNSPNDAKLLFTYQHAACWRKNHVSQTYYLPSQNTVSTVLQHNEKFCTLFTTGLQPSRAHCCTMSAKYFCHSPCHVQLHPHLTLNRHCICLTLQIYHRGSCASHNHTLRGESAPDTTQFQWSRTIKMMVHGQIPTMGTITFSNHHS